MKNLFTIENDLKKWAYWALFVHLLTAIFSVGFYHWDEYFQIFEFLSFKLGHTPKEVLPWEFGAQMRPWLQPAFLYLFKFVFPILDYPFAFMTFARLLAAGISFYSQLAFYNSTKKFFDQKFHLEYFLLSTFLWFMPFLHARFSSENMSSNFYLLGLALFFTKRSVSLIALFWALSFWLRFQMGFALIAPILFLLYSYRNQFNQIILFSLVFLLVIGINVGIDSWGHRAWTFAPWEYAKQNIYFNKSAQFGINPWYDYIKWLFTRPALPFGIVIVTSLVLYFKKFPKDVLTWSIIPFFLAHQLVGHKEFRFLFPLVGLIPFIVFQFKDKFFLNKKFISYPLIAANLILLVLYAFKPMNTNIGLFKFLRTNDSNITSIQFHAENPAQMMADLEPYFVFKSKKPEMKIDRVEDFNADFGKWLHVDRVVNLKAALEKNCQLSYSSIWEIEFLIKYKLIKDKSKGLFLLECP